MHLLQLSSIITLLASLSVFAEPIPKRVKPADIGPKQYRYTKEIAPREVPTSNPNTSPKGALEIIFDASNSMNGRINGVPKIDLAKRAIAHLTTTLNKSQLDVGLRVFGHTKSINIKDMPKASKDSHLVIPIKANSASNILRFCNKIEAHGRTPIAYSLTEAGKDLAKIKSKKPIILLISDGVESCNGNPAEAIKKVIASGIKVETHIIGFNLKTDEKKALQELARAAGGSYYDAQDFSSLLKSFDNFTKKLKIEAPKTAYYANPVKGGKDQPSAQEIKAGKFTLWKHLDKKEKAWFKVNSTATTRVAIKTYISGKQVYKAKDGSFKESPHLEASTSIKVFNKDGKRQSAAVIHGKANEWIRLHSLDSFKEGVYFEIGSDFGCTAKHLQLEVITQQAGDLNEGWEAPNSIKSPGIFEAPLNEAFYGHIGTPDDKDIYKVKLPENSKSLNLDITFSDVDQACRFRVDIYDANTLKKITTKVKLKSKATLLIDTKGAQSVLVAISDNNPKLYYLMNSYKLTFR